MERNVEERQPVRNVPELNLQALLREVKRPFEPRGILEWEKKIKLIFECHNYLETKKVKLAAIEFTYYAMIWWDQLTSSRRRNGERPNNTWAEIKAVMRRRFIPMHYHRELYQKIQNLSQGTRSVEDYYKEMEVFMICTNVDEGREATMARFLSKLNCEIANIVELQHCVEIVDMVHMAIKIEKQLKKKGAARGYLTTNVPRWSQGTSKNASVSQTKDHMAPAKTTKPMVQNSKGKAVESTQNRSRDIKCFKCLGRGHIASQCLNRSAMVIRPNGDIELEEEEDERVKNHAENPTDAEEELEDAVEGEMLVVKRSLGAQGTKIDPQRENLFHTRCFVRGKVCSLVIDEGSCTNVASTLLVEKLDLPTSVHPSPYKLQWLNDGVGLKVTNQVLVPFAIGKYEDEVLCDVVPMHAGHILLGRPRQFG
ncbi:uncharacterized protein [Gossypium hirsutum]|uniref:CCHC-type domain-containing protein n=1 Tax=Gossypium hirsutum TaxID=3635 RepID=A0A1U8NW54_GOSHI|nr:uncharacterized protein LOC107952453 [Gossypium hirsutum]